MAERYAPRRRHSLEQALRIGRFDAERQIWRQSARRHPVQTHLWGLKNGWRDDVNYANAAYLLLEAGAQPSGDPCPTGMAQVDIIITEYLEGDNG